MEVLMSPPTEYTISWEINPWMDTKNQPDLERSWNQWHKLFETYQKLKIKISLILPRKKLADMVFVANAGWNVGRKFVLSNFKYPQRKKEEKYYEKWFKEHGFRVFRLPREVHFEGQGETTELKDCYLFGYGFRSDFEARDYLQRYLKPRKPIIPLRLIDERFYHLDTCLFYIESIDTLIYFPKAFDAESQRKIKKLNSRKFEVSEKEAKSFVLNSFSFKNSVILNAGNLKNQSRIVPFLHQKGLKIINLDTSEYLKSGGGIKCLTYILN
jgi:N-dimethylarginine dimethylaminohydrolase